MGLVASTLICCVPCCCDCGGCAAACWGAGKACPAPAAATAATPRCCCCCLCCQCAIRKPRKVLLNRVPCCRRLQVSREAGPSRNIAAGRAWVEAIGSRQLAWKQLPQEMPEEVFEPLKGNMAELAVPIWEKKARRQFPAHIYERGERSRAFKACLRMSREPWRKAASTTSSHRLPSPTSSERSRRLV